MPQIPSVCKQNCSKLHNRLHNIHNMQMHCLMNTRNTMNRCKRKISDQTLAGCAKDAKDIGNCNFTGGREIYSSLRESLPNVCTFGQISGKFSEILKGKRHFALDKLFWTDNLFMHWELRSALWNARAECINAAWQNVEMCIMQQVGQGAVWHSANMMFDRQLYLEGQDIWLLWLL